MIVIQSNSFKRVFKKLKLNQQFEVDKAIRNIVEKPEIGSFKTANLSNVRVHKFRMTNQETLLAYIYENEILTITLLNVGTHENFYQNLNR